MKTLKKMITNPEMLFVNVCNHLAKYLSYMLIIAGL